MNYVLKRLLLSVVVSSRIRLFQTNLSTIRSVHASCRNGRLSSLVVPGYQTDISIRISCFYFSFSVLRPKHQQSSALRTDSQMSSAFLIVIVLARLRVFAFVFIYTCI